jgi:phosphoribosyl-dephospho-CoA transferase
MKESSDSQECFKRGIERLASMIFSGKHSKTKAEVLMEVMEEYMLFISESAKCLKQKSINYV